MSESNETDMAMHYNSSSTCIILGSARMTAIFQAPWTDVWKIFMLCKLSQLQELLFSVNWTVQRTFFLYICILQ